MPIRPVVAIGAIATTILAGGLIVVETGRRPGQRQPPPPPCVEIVWRFTPDSQNTVTDATLKRNLYIDGVLQPQFSDTLTHVKGYVSDQKYTTVVPRAQFFNHDVRAVVSVNGTHDNAMANPSFAFAGSPCR